MWLLIVWVGLSFVIAALAARKDRSAGNWFCIALLTSPLIGAALLALAGEARSARCPACAERVKREARVCPHCRSAICEPASVPKGAAPRFKSGSAWR